jgi:hypothetical protein
MKFFDWEAGNGFFKLLKTKAPKSVEEATVRCTKWFDKIKDLDPNTEHSNHVFLAGMALWHGDSRPYYNVYPSVAKALLRCRLDVPMGQVTFPTESGTLLVRFCEEVEKIRTVFVAHFADDNWVELSIQVNQDGHKTHHFVVRGTTESLVWDEIHSEIVPTQNCKGLLSELDREVVLRCAHIAVGVALLEHNPEIIVPDVLNEDKCKLSKTIDAETLAKLTDKAHRRHKKGWVIGEELEKREVAGHYRNWTFGLRHTGPGRTVPKIVFIKGSVVNRHKLQEVPTGYLDEEIKDGHP